MTYVIEKNIPWLGRVHHDFPLGDMQVGDSFLVPESNYKSASAIMQKIRIEFQRHKKTHPKTIFRQKQVDGGVRVWRIL